MRRRLTACQSGGLGDGPHTVPYPRAIAKALEGRPELDFSVFEFRLKSSFGGFGFVRLADDVADISALVKYLRGIGKEKVVLIGHSTGCQVCAISPMSGVPSRIYTNWVIRISWNTHRLRILT